MTVFDDCPHVDEREVEEIEAGTRMSVGDYERKLDAVQDTPIRHPQHWDMSSWGTEQVDPSEIERVKGMPPLDKGEDQ